MAKWFDKLVGRDAPKKKVMSYLRSIVCGSFYRVSDIKGATAVSDIKTQIDTMRALANDSQISTALSYYATDATTPNSSGAIIWATAPERKYEEVADIINTLFKKWKVNSYARDHILELATIGNLYIPTTDMYKDLTDDRNRDNIALDQNTIKDPFFDVVASYAIPPEDILHLWYQGSPQGYIYKPTDNGDSQCIRYPESSIIHFSLGGLLGKYTIDAINGNGETRTFDIQFADPLMDRAVQPTQTLSLLEDAVLLSSLTRVVKFINVDCGNAEEEEIQSCLQQIKDAIEQQLSLNTLTGDTQSFVNPQSPNNLIYLPKINGTDAISVTDLNMADATDADNKLLDYYQNKKLSVLGVPKEAMNFSSSEGLGNAGSVMSQRSALYANALARLETAYINGWTDAMNKYFLSKGLSGYVDKFELHMNPIITEMSTLNFDKRDAAISQATTIVELMKSVGVTKAEEYRSALIEILSEVLPKTGTAVNSWNVDIESGGDGADDFE